VTNSKPNIIAIGALGGSGTRTVAQICMEAGCFIGDELNESLDNLIFTHLFKNPSWYRAAKPNGIARRFSVFSKLMEHQRLNASELLVLRNAIKSNKTYPSDAAFLKQYTIRQLIKRKDKAPPTHWGWKEPNTQFYAAHFLTISPHLKYIHVLRHGLDMAFSANKKQLHNWGFLYGLNTKERANSHELSKLQLDFWIESTKRMHQLQNDFPNRVLILNRTELIQSPIEKVTELLQFAELDATEEQIKSLAKIPQKQKSDGRYQNHDLSIFSTEQLEFVKSVGFEV
jgi:hypothetical protein